MKALGLESGAAKVEEEATPTKSIEHANEYIKLKTKVLMGVDKFEEIAIKALESDTNRANKIHQAENLLKRLVKSGSDGKAFKARAKQEFKFATAFE